MGFGDTTTALIFQTSIPLGNGYTLEVGEYTKSSDASPSIPSQFAKCICGIAMSDSTVYGRVTNTGDLTSTTLDFTCNASASGTILTYMAVGR